MYRGYTPSYQFISMHKAIQKGHHNSIYIKLLWSQLVAAWLSKSRGPQFCYLHVGSKIKRSSLSVNAIWMSIVEPGMKHQMMCFRYSFSMCFCIRIHVHGILEPQWMVDCYWKLAGKYTMNMIPDRVLKFEDENWWCQLVWCFLPLHVKVWVTFCWCSINKGYRVPIAYMVLSTHFSLDNSRSN